MATAKKELTFRQYQPGDESRILELFKEVFHREMSFAFWKWRYLDNPCGRAISWLAFDGDRIAGHFAVLPMEVQFEGKLYRAIFPVTAMTHPDYAGLGIFTRLITDIYNYARKQNYDLAYGFFNPNTLYVNVHRAGYRESDIIKMGIWEKKLDTASLPGTESESVIQIQTFDDRADRLWERVKNEFVAIVPRTNTFLNWRFTEYKEIDYPKFVFNKGSDILGYIVLKVYAGENIVRGHIVDLLCIRDEKVVKSLIDRAYGFFREKGISDISCWMTDSFIGPLLKWEGFSRRETGTNFAALVLDRTRGMLLPLEKPENWYLTMGDSDVF